MDASVPQGAPANWPGRYAGQLGGVECTLELWPDERGRLRGHFSSGSERLEVQVTPGDDGTIYGSLREPGETSAVAVFRASLDGDGLTLELDVPDACERPDFSGAEQLRLFRLEQFPSRLGKGGRA